MAEWFCADAAAAALEQQLPTSPAAAIADASLRTHQQDKKEVRCYIDLAQAKHGIDTFAEALADHLKQHPELQKKVLDALEGEWKRRITSNQHEPHAQAHSSAHRQAGRMSCATIDLIQRRFCMAFVCVTPFLQCPVRLFVLQIQLSSKSTKW